MESKSATVRIPIAPEAPDITLVVGGQQFSCHRQVLEKQSPYFQAMFRIDMKEARQQEIHLQDCSKEGVQVLIDYAYSNRFQATEDNVQVALEAAVMFQFDTIREACIDFLQSTLDVTSCLGTMYLADGLGLEDLYQKAKQTALWEARAVLQGPEVMELTRDQLIGYLKHDGLRVTNEMEVFDCIVDWLAADEDARQADFEELLNCVRFVALSMKELRSLTKVPQIAQNEKWKEILSILWKRKFDALEAGDRWKASLEMDEEENTFDLDQILKNETTDVETGVNTVDGSVDAETRCRFRDESDLPLPSALVNQQIGRHSSSKRSRTLPSRRVAFDSEEAGDRVENFSNDDLTPASSYYGFMKRKQAENQTRRCEDKVTSLLKAEHRRVPCVAAVVGEIFGAENQKEANIAIFDHSRGDVIKLTSVCSGLGGKQTPMGYRACAVGKDIYIVGGEYLLGYSNWNMTVQKYDTFVDKWSMQTSLPRQRRHHSLVAHGDHIYVIGGTGKHRVVLDHVDRYNTLTSDWDRLSPLPQPLTSAVCAAHKDHIYAIETLVHRYSPDTNTWSTRRKLELPNQSGFNSAMSHSSGIYLLCRYSKELVHLVTDDEDAYTSEQRARVLGSFTHHADNACIVDDVIYSFSSEGPLLVESFDIRSGRFSVVFDGTNKKLRSPMLNHGCFSIPLYSA